MSETSMEDWRILTGLVSLIVALICFALRRADNSHKKARTLELKTHRNELAIANLRCDIAKEYATKEELRELKEFITNRFDRLETKLLEGKEK